jgi:hypothetical protein
MGRRAHLCLVAQFQATVSVERLAGHVLGVHGNRALQYLLASASKFIVLALFYAKRFPASAKTRVTAGPVMTKPSTSSKDLAFGSVSSILINGEVIAVTTAVA